MNKTRVKSGLTSKPMRIFITLPFVVYIFYSPPFNGTTSGMLFSAFLIGILLFIATYEFEDN